MASGSPHFIGVSSGAGLREEDTVIDEAAGSNSPLPDMNAAAPTTVHST
jgi:hypothetical protein